MQSDGLELFWISGSPPSWRVMLALEFKRITYRSTLLESSKGEHKAPSFLRLNPRGQVPVLRHGLNVVRESIAILAYLEAAKPEPSLFGATLSEKAAIWQWVMDFENNLRPSVTTIAQLLLRRQTRERNEDFARADGVVFAELTAMKGAAASQSFIISNELTEADFVLYPALQWIRRAVFLNRRLAEAMEIANKLNRISWLNAWEKRIENLPWFERTYPPHWRTANG